MIKLENILVATDFSGTSDSALTYGRALAFSFGARLHVLHAVENAFMWTGAEGVAFNLAPAQQEIEAEAARQLEALVGPDSGQEPATTTVLKTGMSAAQAIADYARDAKIDLIVMGTHGRGFVGHLFMGSVAERVVRIAPCPVLTVRQPEHEFVMPDALQAAVPVNA